MDAVHVVGAGGIGCRAGVCPPGRRRSGGVRGGQSTKGRGGASRGSPGRGARPLWPRVCVLRCMEAAGRAPRCSLCTKCYDNARVLGEAAARCGLDPDPERVRPADWPPTGTSSRGSPRSSRSVTPDRPRPGSPGGRAAHRQTHGGCDGDAGQAGGDRPARSLAALPRRRGSRHRTVQVCEADVQCRGFAAGGHGRHRQRSSCRFRPPAGSSSPCSRRTTDPVRGRYRSGGSGRSRHVPDLAGGCPCWPGRSSLAAGDLLLDGRRDREGPDRDRLNGY